MNRVASPPPFWPPFACPLREMLTGCRARRVPGVTLGCGGSGVAPSHTDEGTEAWRSQLMWQGHTARKVRAQALSHSHLGQDPHSFYRNSCLLRHLQNVQKQQNDPAQPLNN